MAVLKFWIKTRVFLRWPHHRTRLLWEQEHPVFDVDFPFGIVPVALSPSERIDVWNVNDIFIEERHFEGVPRIADLLQEPRYRG